MVKTLSKFIALNKGVNRDTDSKSTLFENECWDCANLLLTDRGVKMVRTDAVREPSFTFVGYGTQIRLWEHIETRLEYDVVENRLVLYTGNPDVYITDNPIQMFSNSWLAADTNFDTSKKIRSATLDGGMYFVDGTNRVKKLFGAPLENVLPAIIGDMAPGAVSGATTIAYQWQHFPNAICESIGNSIVVAANDFLYTYTGYGVWSSTTSNYAGTGIHDIISNKDDAILTALDDGIGVYGVGTIAKTGSNVYSLIYNAASEFFYALSYTVASGITKLEKFKMTMPAGTQNTLTSYNLDHNIGKFLAIGESPSYGYYSTGNNIIYKFNISDGTAEDTITLTDTTVTINGMYTNDTYLYFSDSTNDRIGQLKLSDNSVIYYGSRGSAIGQFRNPAGIRYLPYNGLLAVVDSENYRTQIVDFNTNAIEDVYTIDDPIPPRDQPLVTLSTAVGTNYLTPGFYYIKYSYLYESEDGFVESRTTDEFAFVISKDTTERFTVGISANTDAVFTNIYMATPLSPEYKLIDTVSSNVTSLLYGNTSTRGFIIPEGALILQPYSSRPPAGCSIISANHNRMWYVKNNRIYISSLNQPEYCPDLFFDDTPPEQGGWVDVGNGEPIAGLGMYGGFVFIFKNRGIWQISGDPGQQNFGMSQVDDTIGCYSHETIQLCENNVLCWLGNGSVYAFTGDRVMELKGLRKIISAQLPENLANAYAVYYPDKHWYEFTIPTGAETAISWRYQFDVGGKWVRNGYNISTGDTLVRHDGSSIGVNSGYGDTTTLTLKDKFAGAGYGNIVFESKRWEEPIGYTKVITRAKLILDIPATSNTMTFNIRIGDVNSSIVSPIVIPAQMANNNYCVEIPFRFPLHKPNAVQVSIDGGGQALTTEQNVSIIGVELEYVIGGQTVYTSNTASDIVIPIDYSRWDDTQTWVDSSAWGA